MVSSVGRGARAEGGEEGAWNEKGSRWQGSVWRPLPAPSSTARGAAAPMLPLQRHAPSVSWTQTPGQVQIRAALGEESKVPGSERAGGEV